MPETLNFYDCPDCRHEWETLANVRRDDACPRCGAVSLPRGDGPKYRREFPDWPTGCGAPWPEMPRGFRDASWRHDVTPALIGPAGLQIWCNYPEGHPSREPGARYVLMQREGAEIVEVWAADDWQEIRDAIGEIAAGYSPAVAARTMRARLNRMTGQDAAQLLELERLALEPTPDYIADLIAHKWAARLGPIWHIDTPGADYGPGAFSPPHPAAMGEAIAEYESDMRELVDCADIAGIDPYALALDALAHFGHGPGAIEPAAAADLAAKASDYTGGE